jgi:hypothetical protein
MRRRYLQLTAAPACGVLVAGIRFVLQRPSGSRLTLRARMAGRDYVEHLSAPVTVRVR